MQLNFSRSKGSLHLNGINSGQILEALSKKHADDVFIPECKNGETWGARDLLKLDAWVLKRTYSPLTTIGYEIKVNRQDFEQDQKWTSYLDLCHVFYFVCPAGLIRNMDLPQSVGIIWYSQTGALHTKRKPEWNHHPDIEKVNRLLTYVVMARSKIVASMYERNISKPEDRLKGMKEAVERANEKCELAYFVNSHVKKICEEYQKKNSALNQREDTIKRFEEHLARLGIKWDSANNDWQDIARVNNEISALRQIVDTNTIWTMKNTAQVLLRAVAELEEYHKSTALQEVEQE